MLNSEQEKILKKIFIRELGQERKISSFSSEEKNTLLFLKMENYISFKKIEKSEFLTLHVFDLKLLEKGYCYLKNKKINSKKWNNEHDKILYGFMEYLSKTKEVICFSDFDLGNKRPDILTINKNIHIDNINPIIYEIKHSRNDFFTDIKNPEKRKTYLNHSNKFYYVCRNNLIKKEEVPEEAGLIYFENVNEARIIKEPLIKNTPLSEEILIDIIMTLIVRSHPEDMQPQVSTTTKNYFNILNVPKYMARNYKESFIFSSNHSQTLKEVELSSSLRINTINEKYYEDLMFWSLIEKKENHIKLTPKGIQILENQRKLIKNIRKDTPKYFDLSKNIVIEGNIVKNDMIEYITIPITKKMNNILIKCYLKKDEPFECEKYSNNGDFLAHQFFTIKTVEPFIQKDKNIGIVSLYKNSKNEYAGMHIEKRAKKQFVSNKKIIDLLLKILLHYTKEKSYNLYY